MDNKQIIQELGSLSQVFDYLMNNMLEDIDNGVEFGHYYSERVRELSDKLRSLESECKN